MKEAPNMNYTQPAQQQYAVPQAINYIKNLEE